MCGRFTQTTYAHDWREFYDIADPMDWRESWNVAPTRTVAAVRADGEGERHLVGLRWDLIPSWAKDKKIGSGMINARAETVATKPAFRAAYKKRRCIVPMDGYYEWKVTPDGKAPFFIHAASEPLAAAGLWEFWRDPATQQAVESCTILTTDAAPYLREIHDRMPVFLPLAKHAHWLDAETPLEVVGQMLLPMDGRLFAPANKRVGKVGTDGPEMLTPDPA